MITILNIVLLGVIAFWLGSFSSQLLVFLAISIPYYLLARVWKLGRFEAFLLAFPLFALTTNTVLLLSIFNITLSKIHLLVILLILPLAIIFYYHREKLKEELSTSFLREPSFSFGLVLVFVSLFSYSGLLTSSALPLTDATEYLTRTKFVMDSLSEHGRVLTWYMKEQLGYPIFTFDPYLFHLSSGVFSYFSGSSIITNFNFIFLIYMCFFALSAFLLFRFLFKDDLLAFCAAALLIVNPKMSIMAVYTGNIKIFSAYASVPLVMYYILRLFDSPRVRVLLPLLLFNQLISHTNTLLFLLCFFAVFIAYHLAKKIKMITLDEVLGLAKPPVFAALAFIVLGLYFIVPVLYFSNYVSSVEWTFGSFNFSEALSPLLSEPTSTALDSSMGILYGMFLVISLLLVLFAAVRIVRGKGSFTSHHLFILLFIFAFLLMLLLMSNIAFLGKTVVGYGRIEPFVFLLFSATFAAAISAIKEFSSKIYMVALFLVFIAILHYALITSERTNTFVSETFFLHHSGTPSALIAQLPERIITYGMYGTSLHPAISSAYNKSTNGMGYLQGQHTNIYINYLNSIEQGWTLPNSTDASVAYKLLRITATNTIWVNVCTQGGYNTLAKFNACNSCIFSNITKQDECNHFLFLNSSFVEGFSVLPNFTDYDALVPVPQGYARPDDETILIQSPKSKYLLVKEEYFPRWSAYQEDAGTVPIRMSDLGLMIVENKNNKPIKLVYDLFLWEKLLMAASVALMVLLLYWPSRWLAEEVS